jgi:hypothetical protein
MVVPTDWLPFLDSNAMILAVKGVSALFAMRSSNCPLNASGYFGVISAVAFPIYNSVACTLKTHNRHTESKARF